MQTPTGSCHLSLQRTGGDHEDAPTSHDWAPYSRIWDSIISHCLKQWIWSRTGLFGGCGRRTALRDLELHARKDDDEGLIFWRSLQADGARFFYRPDAIPVTKPTVLKNWRNDNYVLLVVQHNMQHALHTSANFFPWSPPVSQPVPGSIPGKIWDCRSKISSSVRMLLFLMPNHYIVKTLTMHCM